VHSKGFASGNSFAALAVLAPFSGLRKTGIAEIREKGYCPDAMNSTLRETAFLFLKLGTIGFGGPAATIALMEDEVVRRRRWVSREDFLDLLGAANIIPGPNSTEMAIFIGHRRAGWPGLILAGICFIFPAAAIVTMIAWAYTRYGTLPQANAILYGVKPVILAVVLQALWGLSRSAVKSRLLGTVCVAGILLGFIGVNELTILFVGGLIVAAIARIRNRPKRTSVFSLQGAPLLMAAHAATAAGSGAATFGLLPLFLFFLKVGSVLYGSGYVLLAFLQADLVTRWHWLTESQLLDAIAVGQVTPGPVFTTATFIGYILGGPFGAFLATVGIFLPAFLFVALSGPLLPRIRRSSLAGAFLDGVIVTSLSLMAVVTYRLGRATLVDVFPIVLVGISAVLLLRFRVNSAWLVLGGALAGLFWGQALKM
jgi:chromate transporter